jgi:2-keto-3-deoxy-L-rhamnonate aldolase RhmA
MEKNSLLSKFEKGEKMIGSFFTTASVVTAEIMGGLGYDFIVIDVEHGQHDFQTVESFIRAAECRNVVPIVRIVDTSRNYILKMLDLGAMGLFLPFIKTTNEVKQAVNYAKYPPVGERGLGYGHKVGYGVDPIVNTGRLEDYLEWANENTLLIPQCETVEAVKNIEEIVAINEVTGIFIGPFDLSISMGIPGQFDNPEFVETVERVKVVCNKARKMIFTVDGTVEGAVQKLRNGFDGILTSDTPLFMNAAKSYINNIRALNRQ